MCRSRWSSSGPRDSNVRSGDVELVEFVEHPFQAVAAAALGSLAARAIADDDEVLEVQARNGFRDQKEILMTDVSRGNIDPAPRAGSSAM